MHLQVKNKKSEKEHEKRPEIIIKSYGHEYILVECQREGVRSPAAFGKIGYAIKAVRKIKNTDIYGNKK